MARRDDVQRSLVHSEYMTTHAAIHHEVTLVQLTFDFYTIEAKPEKLIGDKAYDSDDLDEELKEAALK